MIRSAAISILLSACAADPGVQPTPSGDDAQEPIDVPSQPATCFGTYTLAGVDPPATIHIDPLAIDHAGIALCLHLDATQNIVRAHFGTQTDRFDAVATPFGSILRENGATVVEGWDLTFGSSPPTSFHTLEWGMAKGEVHDVVLHVFAKSVTSTSRIDISMFEPFE